jgi:hypothetical protein
MPNVLTLRERIALLRDEAHALERVTADLVARSEGITETHQKALTRVANAEDHLHNAVRALAAAVHWMDRSPTPPEEK